MNHTVSHSLSFSIQLFSKHLLKEPLLLCWPSMVLWVNMVGNLCWRADFNLIILTWVWWIFVLGFFYIHTSPVLISPHILLKIVWAQLSQEFPDVYFSGCSSSVESYQRMIGLLVIGPPLLCCWYNCAECLCVVAWIGELTQLKNTLCVTSFNVSEGCLPKV